MKKWLLLIGLPILGLLFKDQIISLVQKISPSIAAMLTKGLGSTTTPTT